MASSKLTGISNISGKTVYIRHATEWGMVMLAQYLNEDTNNVLDHSEPEVVVAVEDNRIISFGILQKANADTGCVTVKEDEGQSRIGTYIVRHLMEHSSMKNIYVASNKPENLKKLGFTECKPSPGYSRDDGRSMCHWGA